MIKFMNYDLQMNLFLGQYLGGLEFAVFYRLLFKSVNRKFEPRYEKTGLRGFRPGPT